MYISTIIINQTYEKSELVSKAKNIINLVSYFVYTFEIYLFINVHFYWLQILEKKFVLSNELEDKMKNFLNTN